MKTQYVSDSMGCNWYQKNFLVKVLGEVKKTADKQQGVHIQPVQGTPQRSVQLEEGRACTEDAFTDVMEDKIMYDLVGPYKVDVLHSE